MYIKDTRVCPVCERTVDRSEMTYTRDCHGIPYRLVCWNCYTEIMEASGYDGEYYTEAEECIDYDY